MVAVGTLREEDKRGRKRCRPGLGRSRQIGPCPLRVWESSNIFKEANSIDSVRKRALGTLSSGSV